MTLAATAAATTYAACCWLADLAAEADALANPELDLDAYDFSNPGWQRLWGAIKSAATEHDMYAGPSWQDWDWAAEDDDTNGDDK